MADTNLQQISDDLFVFQDTCNVYVLRDGDAAILIDLGDGKVLEALPSLGVSRVEWVLFTHHHREQCQGAHRLSDETQIAAPAAERAFFENPLSFRRAEPSLAQPFSNNGASYLRVPRAPIRVDRAFERMDAFRWRGHEFWTLQTPGNSPGAMSYFLRRDHDWLAFTGDVMLDGARLHTWFDSEWDYGYAAGLQALYDSAFAIERFAPRLMLPSHGALIENPLEQLPRFRDKLKYFTRLYLRGWDMTFRSDAADNVSRPSAAPHVWQIAPHLYKFGGSGFGGNFHMILSDSGHALFIDCGGWGADWLDARIADMRAHLGLKQIDAVIVTHMHGDHLLDCPHVRDKYGAELWTLDMIAETCEHGERFDYTCPIAAYGGQSNVPIDRTFARGEVLSWQGFDLTFDWLPGQTEFALIVYGEIDGRLVAFTGDNIFRSDDADGHDAVIARNSGLMEEGYLYTVKFLSRLQPDLILAGHSVVIENPAPQLERYLAWAHEFRAALAELSSDENYEYFFDPFWLRAYPYRVEVKAGASATLKVLLRNHRDRSESHRIEIKAPSGWRAEPPVLQGAIAAREKCEYEIALHAPAEAAPGVHLFTFDITLDEKHLGEWFDAMVNVTKNRSPML